MLLAVLAYMGAMAGWKVLRMGSISPLFSQWPFLVGIPVGVLFVWIDVVVESYLHPGSQTSRLLHRMIYGNGGMVDRVQRTISLVRTLATRDAHLCSQNVLFAGLWIVMALFGLTSTTSAFGKGVVLGIGLQIVVRLVQSLRAKGQGLRAKGSREETRMLPSAFILQPSSLSWFFWPIRQGFSFQQERLVAGGFLAIFALLTFLA